MVWLAPHILLPKCLIVMYALTLLPCEIWEGGQSRCDLELHPLRPSELNLRRILIIYVCDFLQLMQLLLLGLYLQKNP